MKTGGERKNYKCGAYPQNCRVHGLVSISPPRNEILAQTLPRCIWSCSVFFLCGRSCFLFWRGSCVAFPADADEFRDAGLLHGDAVEYGAGLHGFAVMGDDDELRLAAHVADEAGEAADVGFVERRVHFVEDAERARLVAEDGDEQ